MIWSLTLVCFGFFLPLALYSCRKFWKVFREQFSHSNLIQTRLDRIKKSEGEIEIERKRGDSEQNNILIQNIFYTAINFHSFLLNQIQLNQTQFNSLSLSLSISPSDFFSLLNNSLGFVSSLSENLSLSLCLSPFLFRRFFFGYNFSRFTWTSLQFLYIWMYIFTLLPL